MQGRPAAFDIVVTDREGGPVWRRPEGEVVVAVLQLPSLGPGEAVEFEAMWDQPDQAGVPVPAGEYLVTGQVPSDPPRFYTTAPAKLLIRP